MFDTVIRGGTVVDGTGGAPFTGDVAIENGVIVEVGEVDGPARREIDAAGALVTPGWIDGHTHYDGQVTWDDLMVGSSANGVTTGVMGNCGVGFAPVRPGDAEALVDLMAGVEDIPGTALFEGVPWGKWETVAEYMDFLGSRSYALDVGVQVAHGPLRFYVMGERAIGDTTATHEDMEQFATIIRQATAAGALGFSTSRVQGHRALSGYTVPGTDADAKELLTIAHAMREGGGGVFQAVPASTIGDISPETPEHTALMEEVRMLTHISRETQQNTSFTMFQHNDKPEAWREVLDLVAAENATGALVRPMVAPRAVTMLSTLRGYHPFLRRPTFLRIKDLPLDQLVEQMRRPEIRSAILQETDEPNPTNPQENMFAGMLERQLPRTYPLQDPLDYEPSPSDSMTGRAAAAGVTETAYVYDFLLQEGGQSVGLVLGFNYAQGNLDACREWFLDPATVSGCSDAGAHVNFVCDMAMPSFNLTHWVRDRNRGPKLPVELVVSKWTSALADLYNLNDRGRLQVGKRADINVIDLEGMRTEVPHLEHDLPAGGARFIQRSTGYLATMLNGVMVRERDEDTGARPGSLVRNKH